MPGIEKINQGAEQRTASTTGSFGPSELILNADGDQAVVAVVASGNDDNDDRIVNYYRHSYKDEEENRWIYAFCKKTINERCEMCDRDLGAQNRFAFWAYVYFLLRKNPGSGEGWKEIIYGGEKLFQLEIKDFKVVTLPFGRKDMFWNQFVGVFYEHEAMNKVAIRVKREGAGRDTVWSIGATSTAVNWKEIGNGGDSLGSVNDFFMDRDAKRNQQTESVALPIVNESNGTKNDDDMDVSALF
jgi:hypothetical protein